MLNVAGLLNIFPSQAKQVTKPNKCTFSQTDTKGNIICYFAPMQDYIKQLQCGRRSTVEGKGSVSGRRSSPKASVTSHRVEGEETDWPALWGAVSSGRIPKDTRWPQPAPTWWGAHSVCRRSSPSPTLRPKPRPSWVTWSCVLPATHKCTQPKAIYDPGVRMKPEGTKKKKVKMKKKLRYPIPPWCFFFFFFFF